MLRWKKNSDEETKQALKTADKVLEEIAVSNWELKNIENKLLEAAGEKRGDLLWPLRAALTGLQKSPSPFEVVWVLGKKESINRIEKALNLF